MNNAFKNLGDFIGGLTGLLMSLIGLAIVAEVAGLNIPGVAVIDSITNIIGDFAGGGFVGLVALLAVLALAKK
ncbi:MAG: hypothetical protein CMP56_02005 [Flavobacteriales bacterium]|jgi:hypothetical protein|nr:hypothetical protein [Flavobacteriales bacterium]|tara:strand:- start:78 stop:296 length:219 start_codon:yes stop_codon:yes gene_type:complete